jgi:hypothetical protein
VDALDQPEPGTGEGAEQHRHHHEHWASPMSCSVHLASLRVGGAVIAAA